VPTPVVCIENLGLTRAEATVVSLLAAGCSIKEICSRLQIRLSTVRTHLRHLYEKTNTSRQAELVSYVLRECERQHALRRG
jgi:DNA-binding CsgD family transcriptional regulator